MCRHNKHSITILKTPYGYLTNTGFTENINSRDIVAVWSNNLKRKNKKRQLRYFFKHCFLSSKIKQVLEQACLDECIVWAFECPYANSCCSCYNSKYCNFWNGNRDKLEFTKLN